MAFAETIRTGSGNNVYLKGLGDKPVNPSFEVHHPDGSVTSHKALVDVEFISIEPNLFKNEEYGDKMQARINFLVDGVEYRLSANLTYLMIPVVNSLLGAGISKGDKFSIQLSTKEVGKKLLGQALVLVNEKMPEWKYSSDELLEVSSDKGEAMYKILERDFGVKDLAEELDAEAEAVKTKPKAKKETTEDEDSLPF